MSIFLACAKANGSHAKRRGEDHDEESISNGETQPKKKALEFENSTRIENILEKPYGDNTNNKINSSGKKFFFTKQVEGGPSHSIELSTLSHVDNLLFSCLFVGARGKPILQFSERIVLKDREFSCMHTMHSYRKECVTNTKLSGGVDLAKSIEVNQSYNPPQRLTSQSMVSEPPSFSERIEKLFYKENICKNCNSLFDNTKTCKCKRVHFNQFGTTVEASIPDEANTSLSDESFSCRGFGDVVAQEPRKLTEPLSEELPSYVGTITDVQEGTLDNESSFELNLKMGENVLPNEEEFTDHCMSNMSNEVSVSEHTVSPFDSSFISEKNSSFFRQQMSEDIQLDLIDFSEAPLNESLFALDKTKKIVTCYEELSQTTSSSINICVSKSICQSNLDKNLDLENQHIDLQSASGDNASKEQDKYSKSTDSIYYQAENPRVLELEPTSRVVVNVDSDSNMSDSQVSTDSPVYEIGKNATPIVNENDDSPLPLELKYGDYVCDDTTYDFTSVASNLHDAGFINTDTCTENIHQNMTVSEYQISLITSHNKDAEQLCEDLISFTSTEESEEIANESQSELECQYGCFCLLSDTSVKSTTLSPLSSVKSERVIDIGEIGDILIPNVTTTQEFITRANTLVKTDNNTVSQYLQDNNTFSYICQDYTGKILLWAIRKVMNRYLVLLSYRINTQMHSKFLFGLSKPFQTYSDTIFKGDNLPSDVRTITHDSQSSASLVVGRYSAVLNISSKYQCDIMLCTIRSVLDKYLQLSVS